MGVSAWRVTPASGGENRLICEEALLWQVIVKCAFRASETDGGILLKLNYGVAVKRAVQTVLLVREVEGLYCIWQMLSSLLFRRACWLSFKWAALT
jgi:hypothetical protein